MTQNTIRSETYKKAEKTENPKNFPFFCNNRFVNLI